MDLGEKSYTKKVRKEKGIEMNNLFEHFNTLFGENVETHNDNEHYNDISDRQLDAEITLEGIRKAVFHQKNGKSSGPDGISSEIKSSFVIIAPYLCILYNKLFNNSVYPESWGLGYIVPTQSKNEEHETYIRLSIWISKRQKYHILCVFITCNHYKCVKFGSKTIQCVYRL